MRAGRRSTTRIEGYKRSLPADSVVQLIEAHAARTPNAVALTHQECFVSYRELSEGAQAVATALREHGVEPGATVAIWAHRRPSLVAAALGAFYARAAYAPIDPTYPEHRVRSILRVARPVAMLYDGNVSLPPSNMRCPAMDVTEIPLRSARGSRSVPRPEDAAYVVFTSGSSGEPKGVVVEHRSLLNYVCWCGSVVGSGGIGAPLFASLGFDHAMTCLWVPLAHGKHVTLAELWESESIFQPTSGRYTFLKLTPSHARFFERLMQPRYLEATHLVMFGGEALSPTLLEQIGPRLGGVRVVNHYGPSEATVGCCWHELASGELLSAETVPIGKPIWNSRAYVVDEELRPVAAGVEGELVMGGLCVARGYLKDDGHKSFIPGDALASDEQALLYRTGDLVCQLEDGPLVYRGRRDNQVKISGYRVELDELRLHALSVPAVAEVAFEVVHGEMDEVEVFVVSAESSQEDRRELIDAVHAALANVLPGQVVPRKINMVDQLVFDAHGKCDLASTRRLCDLRGMTA